MDSTPTRKSNTVTLSLEKREADRFCERERDKSERSRRRGNEPPGRRPLISVGFFRFSFWSVFFIFPENHSNSSFYLHGTFLHLYRGALLFFYHTLRTKNTVTVVPFCEKVFSFDLFARVLRIPSFASRLLRRDFERQIGWTAHKHSSEREKKKAILAAVSNFESDDRAIVPAKSARVQIRDDFLIHAFASRMICARFSSLHIRVVVPGGAREVNREKSKNLISQRER
jgi:hypothetical protein